MSLPANWTLVNVFGTYLNLDGSPAVGEISFESGQIVVIDDITVVPGSKKVQLDDTGSFSTYLPSTNDPELDVTGWAYTVHERIEGGRADYNIFVEYDSDPIDLALVSPVVPPVNLTAIATKAQINALDARIDILEDNEDADDTTVAAHIADVANPHAVTKTQVGLGNADNTSDVNKPVSTAQAAADTVVLNAAAADATAKADAKVIDSIADADTTHAPSRNSVFDALALKLDTSTASSTYEPVLAAGTTAQFYRGDKTWSDSLVGPLGIGIATSPTVSLRVGRALTGGVGVQGISQIGTVQSDVTSSVTSFSSSLTTAAASFTVGTMRHFHAAQNGSFGAGSSVTTQIGYSVDSTLTSATNNYGFYGAIAAGTARFNLYMVGTADNYMAGRLGLGSATLTSISFRNSVNITGAASAYGNFSNGVIQSDVTTLASYYTSGSNTQAASFTCGALRHFNATQGTFGASSVITSQYGFYAEATLTGATNNYGFYSDLPAGTGRWNIYANGAAPNYMAGKLGVGVVPAVNVNLQLNKTLTGSATGYNLLSSGAVQSDVTTGIYYGTSASTQAAAFTTSLTGFIATQGTLGVGSVVGTQYGFYADATLVGGAVNYGFFSNIASELLGASATVLSYTARTINNVDVTSNVVTVTTSVAHGFVTGQAINHSFGTNTQLNGNKTVTGTPTGTTYTFAQTTANVASMVDTGTATPVRNFAVYTNGTAASFFGGRVGIGVRATQNVSLYVAAPLTGGSTSTGMYNAGIIQSDATGGARYFNSFASTQATAFTCLALSHFIAQQGTFGAGSAVTNQYGFFVDSTLIGATNNYGFYGNLAAGTGRFNLYMAGTADNFLQGRLAIGIAPSAVANLYIVKAFTGGTAYYGIYNTGTIQSDVTSTAQYFVSSGTTVAASFTLGSMIHFAANQGTIGAGSAVTTQYGFFATNSLTGAATNYGFYSDIAAGSARWNFYASGTADNYMAGKLGIGTGSLSTVNVNISKIVTGGTSAFGTLCQGAIQSDVTSLAAYFASSATTQATSFTLASLRHYSTDQGTFGAGSTVTSQYGFYAASNLTGAATNYGFYGTLAASGTARYNFYAGGTAPNVFIGQTSFGAATLDASALLNVVSTTQGILFPRMTTTQRDAISSPTEGLVIYNTTTHKLNVRVAAAWEAVTSA